MTLSIERAEREGRLITQYGIDNSDLCRWDAWSKSLLGSQKHKAREFNRLKLIRYLGNGRFCCLPIQGYNQTTYVLEKKEGSWTCSCQWFCKQGLTCSHLQALFLFFSNQNGEGIE